MLNYILVYFDGKEIKNGVVPMELSAAVKECIRIVEEGEVGDYTVGVKSLVTGLILWYTLLKELDI